MTQIPSIHDLEVLGDDIANNGTTSHSAILTVLAEAAEAVAMNQGAAQVLSDSASPEVARLRAFAIIARNWPAIYEATQQSAFRAASRLGADIVVDPADPRRSQPLGCDHVGSLFYVL